MRNSSIGLHFLCLYLPLVSAPIYCQGLNRQVSDIASVHNFLSSGLCTCEVGLKIDSNFCDSLNEKGHSSTISTVYRSDGSVNDSIEVGQGNLKLLYSADEGKLTRYVNSRNLVSSQYAFISLGTPRLLKLRKMKWVLRK